MIILVARGDVEMNVNYTAEATNMIKGAGVESYVKDIIKDIGSRFENVERLSFEIEFDGNGGESLLLLVFGENLLLDNIRKAVAYHKKNIAKANIDFYVGEGL